MITIDINKNGFASEDAWARVLYDPSVPDTYTIHTSYPPKYSNSNYKLQYIFKNEYVETDRLELDSNGDIPIPLNLINSETTIKCKFIVTLISNEKDVLTSTFALTLTPQSSSYLNHDADKFIVVPSYEAMQRIPADYLANEKVIKVAHDSKNNQRATFYYWDAITKSFIRDPELNRSVTALCVDSEEDMLSISDISLGTLVYRADKKSTYILVSQPPSDPSSWEDVFNTISLPDASSVTSEDYLLIVSDGTQKKVTVDQLEAAIGNWKPIQ